MRLSTWCALLVFAATHAATAGSDTFVDSVVKVHSGVCRSDQIDFRGSGLMFEKSGRAYVLTSEHVVLHANEPYCHSVMNVDYKTRDAKLIAVDWGTGLALLEVRGAKPSLTWDRVERSLLPRLVPGIGVATVGFPYASERRFVDSGRVLDSEGRRGLFPEFPVTLEIIGAHGEFGMSGGLLLDETKTHLLGFLSHQYLELVPGGRTATREHSIQSSMIQNLLIGIRASDAVGWVNDVFTLGRNYAPGSTRDPRLQIKKEDAVFSAGLQFSWISCDDPEYPAIGGGQGAGVGGGQGAGVGGGQGAGVGGADGGVDSANTCQKLRISLDSMSQERRGRWPDPETKAWIESVRERLNKREVLVLPYFTYRDSERSLKRREFSSLAEVFTLLRDSRFEPVVVASATLPGRESSAVLTNLQQDATKLNQIAKVLFDLNTDLSARLLLKQTQLVAELLGSASWDLVVVRDLSDLQLNDRSREAWDRIFASDFNQAVELMHLIGSTRDQLERLKI